MFEGHLKPFKEAKVEHGRRTAMAMKPKGWQLTKKWRICSYRNVKFLGGRSSAIK